MWKLTRRCVFCWVLLSYLLVGGVRPLFAHGDDSTPQLTGVEIGPYMLSLWTYPPILRPGGIAFESLITDSRTGLPALNCNLDLEITIPDGSVITTAARPATVATAYEFQSDVHLHMPGEYQIKALVGDGGQDVGATTFKITVVSDSLWLNSLVTVELTVGVVALLWLLWEGRKVWGLAPRSRPSH